MKKLTCTLTFLMLLCTNVVAAESTHSSVCAVWQLSRNIPDLGGISFELNYQDWGGIVSFSGVTENQKSFGCVVLGASRVVCDNLLGYAAISVFRQYQVNWQPILAKPAGDEPIYPDDDFMTPVPKEQFYGGFGVGVISYFHYLAANFNVMWYPDINRYVFGICVGIHITQGL